MPEFIITQQAHKEEAKAKVLQVRLLHPATEGA
jgi:hypothetical protein